MTTATWIHQSDLAWQLHLYLNWFMREVSLRALVPRFKEMVTWWKILPSLSSSGVGKPNIRTNTVIDSSSTRVWSGLGDMNK